MSPNSDFVYKSTTIHTQNQAIKTGLGLGILPHFVAYGENDLSQLLPEFYLERELWISTSKDLHQFKDLKLTWDFIINSCQKEKYIFLGNRQ
ncbi:hypothetical protein ACLKMH_14650 [Psychromonas sp. KJ10-10]|uniref:hypothetical protein n=1 Tax=Psychromonas sp. KJ10-10 TaxID=3391823 RepID=UPI0039B5362D